MEKGDIGVPVVHFSLGVTATTSAQSLLVRAAHRAAPKCRKEEGGQNEEVILCHTILHHQNPNSLPATCWLLPGHLPAVLSPTIFHPLI